MATDRRPDEPGHLDAAQFGLVEYMVRATPTLREPYHLAPFVDEYEHHALDGSRVVLVAPVQHGKTTLMNTAIAWTIARDPSLSVIYVSFGDRFSQRQSRVIRRLALRSGVHLQDDHNTISEWRTTQDGGLLATSRGGEITGHPADVIFIDDLIKNREEAESEEVREQAWETVQSDIMSRVGPRTTIFLQGSRWHEDDPAGRALKTGDWRLVHLKAIDDQGRALCPDGPNPKQPRDLAFLLRQRRQMGEYAFSSLFQGDPKPRGAKPFHEPHYYQLAPVAGFRIALGCDLAYKKGGDFLVVVVLVEVGETYYVIDVVRTNEGIARVKKELRHFLGTWPSAPLYSYAEGGADAGPIELLDEDGIHVECMPPKWSKLVRAFKTIAAWNDGKILLPTQAPWVGDFKREVTAFTGGAGDSYDDQVDALVAAYDGLQLTKFDTMGAGFFHGRRVV